MSHDSTTCARGVILALFMAAMRHSPGDPVLLFGLLDVNYNTMLPSSIPKLSASPQNRSVFSDRAF